MSRATRPAAGAVVDEDKQLRVRRGAALRALREDAGLSREELAVKAGVSFPTVGDIERGTTDPKGSTLTRLAEALDCSVDDLLLRRG